jgi:hypothetical protein
LSFFSFRRGGSGVLALAGCLLGVASAQAQGANVAAAEALFRDGKERMAAKDYARGCPKLADSFRLDPATGTLLALALCHEREGKLASAWAEYAEAAARSKRESRADREKAAQDKVAGLEPKLSQLTIALAPGIAETGLEITRNGAAVGTGTLGSAVPIDGGSYAIEATAPRKKPWRGKVNVSPSGDKQTLTIPRLEDDPIAAIDPKARKLPAIRPGDTTSVVHAAPAGAAPAAPAAKETPPADNSHHFGWVETTFVAAGVVGLGIGTVFMLQAVGKNEQSESGCDANNICSPQATQDRLDARQYGQIATVSYIAGGALVATGVAIYLIGGANQANPERSSASLQAAPLPVNGGFGGMLRGTF